MKQHGLHTLDLHGTLHTDVPHKVETFIFKYFSEMPVKIICGNSTRMTEIVIDKLSELELWYQRGVGNDWNTFTVYGDKYE